MKRALLYDKKNKINSIFLNNKPYTDSEIQTVIKYITDDPKLIDLKYKSTGYNVDMDFYTAFMRDSFHHIIEERENKVQPWLFSENMVPLMLSILSLTSCEYNWYRPLNTIKFLFESIVWIGCPFDKLLPILKKLLDRIDECKIIKMKKEKKKYLEGFVDKIYYSGVFRNNVLSVEKKIDYILKTIDVFFSTDMTLGDDKDIRSSKVLMANDIFIKKLLDYGCILEKPGFQNLIMTNPVFSKDAEFYDSEIMPVEGIARGEFFYNIRDVDADGRITRAFSKLSFDKLENNPFTRREWKNTANTNNRRRVDVGKKNNNSKVNNGKNNIQKTLS